MIEEQALCQRCLKNQSGYAVTRPTNKAFDYDYVCTECLTDQEKNRINQHHEDYHI